MKTVVPNFWLLGWGGKQLFLLLTTPSNLKQMNSETFLERFELFIWRPPRNEKDILEPWVLREGQVLSTVVT